MPNKKTHDKVQETRKKEQDKKYTTYVEIAKRAVQEAHRPESTVLNLSEPIHDKVMISMIHAHLHNIIAPGSYNEELRKMFKLNNLPEMIFPENPQSEKLFQTTYASELRERLHQDEQRFEQQLIHKEHKRLIEIPDK